MKGPVLAKHLMSRPVRRLTSAATVRDAAAFLVRWKISGAPVVDVHGRWVGVFTLADVARVVQARLAGLDRTLETRVSVPDGDAFWAGFERTPVGQVMTPGMVTVFPDAPRSEVIRSLNSLPIHRVFVVDPRKGSLLGVITTRDVLRSL
jgi:CIC family chloride channel protein